jgi:hypothetical protein
MVLWGKRRRPTLSAPDEYLHRGFRQALIYQVKDRPARSPRGRAGKRGHSRPRAAHTERRDPTVASLEVPANRDESPRRRDTFTYREPVTRCTRFVPERRAPALPMKKKLLQKPLEPTPGLEPGTPSLRVKRV